MKTMLTLGKKIQRKEKRRIDEDKHEKFDDFYV